MSIREIIKALLGLREEDRPAYEGGEIVRLNLPLPEDGLAAGSHGFVWGVYVPEYEASFLDASGEFVDVMFQPHQVTLVSLDSVQHSERLRFEEFERRLREFGNRHSVVEWCCPGFRDHVEMAGERGTGIFTSQEHGGAWQFIIQFRAFEPGGEIPTTEGPMSFVTDVVIRCCPWCGANLGDAYQEPDLMERSDLRISLR